MTDAPWMYMKGKGGKMVKVVNDTDHEEVQLEQKEILAQRQEHRQGSGAFFTMVVGFLVNLAVLGVLVGGSTFLLSNVLPSTIVAIVVATTYAIVVIAGSVGRMAARVDRMEIHALTLHERLLQLHDKVDATD